MDSSNIQQLKRGTLEMILLSLIYKHGCSYGYAILNELDRLGGDFFRNPKAGTVYPVLYRLEERNLIRETDALCNSETSKNGRKKQDSDPQKAREQHKRSYELTDEGVKALSNMIQQWQSYVLAVDKLI